MITYGMNRLFFSITLFCLAYATIDTTERSTEITDEYPVEIDVTEGSIAKLTCKEYGDKYLWYNDSELMENNARVTQSNEPPVSILTIENVTRWDSRNYLCIIKSKNSQHINYNLRVLYPPENLSLEVVGAKESTTVGGKVKKFIVKQGEPFQFICNVDGKPKPNVQWIKREKDQQMLLDAQSQVLDQSKASPQQLPTLIVSNTSEFKIESANAQHDAGHYECIAQNKLSVDSPTNMELELVIEYPPKILSLEVVGARESTTAGEKVKKFIVKQGEPIQFICKVDGNPEPDVQWTKREKDQQMLLDAQAQVLDQSKASLQQLPTLIVSNMSEFKIESANAQLDAGHYECTAKNKQSEGSQTNMELELVIEYPPSITVSQPVIHTGETNTARIVCTVDAFPVANVTWEKEQTNANGSSSYVQLSTNDNRSHYQTFSAKNIVNKGSTPRIFDYGLNVTLQSSEDFGNYRCKAENHLGNAYSDKILLTVLGTPALPQHSGVHIKSGLPELSWKVDSLPPILEYQLRLRRSQDPINSWYEVRPQPQVVDSSYFDSKRREYTVSYVFGDDNKQEQLFDGSNYVPLTLQSNTTYVTNIRARNKYGWSEWSANYEFSGMDFYRSNEIKQNDDVHVADISSIIIILFVIVAVLSCIGLSLKLTKSKKNMALDGIQSTGDSEL